MARPLAKLLTVLLATTLFAAACGGSSNTSEALDNSVVDDSGSAEELDEPRTSDTPGVRLVTATEGAAIADNPPDGLVVLDVRTLEEFVEGHLDDATMLDFYQSDFGEQLLQLDKDVPYLLYCRSGNRSGQTAAMMQQLGFTDVADVDGGIVSWEAAGFPVTAG